MIQELITIIYGPDIVREVKFDEGEVWNKHVYIQIHKVVAMHTISLSLSPLVSTASRTVNVLVTTELCLEPSRDVATALIVTYYPVSCIACDCSSNCHAYTFPGFRAKDSLKGNVRGFPER